MTIASALTTLESLLQRLVGSSSGSTYTLSRWVFLRALGVIFLIAFVSLWVQIKGLIGSQGILPARELLAAAQAQLGGERYRILPTVFWLGASDTALQAACALGAACAVLLIADVAPAPMLVLLWLLYLSLTVVGRDFLSFQWDVLLLETAVLALFLAPWRLLPARSETAVPALGLLLLWWLVFRLTFASGVVKLTWGDATWHNLTALDYHYWTQPLPTWTAWYMSHFPEGFKRASVVLTYVLEIGFPLLLFGPRTLRLVGCAGIVLMQVMIFTTGNYNFFNLLTLALAGLLLDDRAWSRILPDPLVRWVAGPGPVALEARGLGLVGTVLALVLFVLATVRFAQTLTPRGGGFGALSWLESFRSINGYGLFRVMTTTRREIVVQGSDDGTTWRSYEFRYKPGDPLHRPGFIEPHQPRLDWQMWFASLAPYEVTYWFQDFLTKLLQGSPPVLGLLRTNPFPDHAPKYVRAVLYDYHFTTTAERRVTGAWWTRTYVGQYSPVLSLQ